MPKLTTSLSNASPAVSTTTSTPSTPSTDSPLRPIRLHGRQPSSHGHRVELFLSLLGRPFEKVGVDLARAEPRGAAFLALNKFGQLPVTDHGELVLADSNAILVYVYLALTFGPGAQWLPRDAVGAARVQRWLRVATGQLAGGPAAIRVAVAFGQPVDQAPARRRSTAVRADGAAPRSAVLPAAPHPTIAGVALYHDTADAAEWQRRCAERARLGTARRPERRQLPEMHPGAHAAMDRRCFAAIAGSA